tara:strand:- start:1150 stop:1776 length:627 start_codon:yes stop_codon:yes gene_type:complete
MNFNGKNLIIIGSILFLLQLINFFSINLISPEIERAQVLAAISSIIIVLIGLLFQRISPISGEKVTLEGENGFIYDPSIPKDLLNELAWGSEAVLTSTAAATILINNKGKNILKRGIISKRNFIPKEICLRCLEENKFISLVNTKFYPGSEEFDDFCKSIPSVLVIPVNKQCFILVGGWSSRCFTKSDEKWILNWSKKLLILFKESNF